MELANWIADVLDATGATPRQSRVREVAIDDLPAVPGLRVMRRHCGMHCPFCNHEDTNVIDSRLAGEGQQIRRRRECLACGERFTTFETAELVMPRVVKNDDDAASRSTSASCAAACRRRWRSAGVARGASMRRVVHICHKLRALGEREVASRSIGELVMEELQHARRGRLRALRVGLSQLPGRRRVPRGDRALDSRRS